MRRSHFLRSLLGAALLAVLLTACGSSTAPTAEDPGPSEDPQGPTQTAQPSITSLSTTAAPRGSTLVITGLDLGEEGGTVTIGGAQAAVAEWSDTVIQVAVPEGAPNAWQDVTVTTEGGSATQPGLFVGAEFLGDDHELLDFLGQQPAGSAVLLGARTYDLREEAMFLLDNVDLHGRGAGETELQFPDGGTLVLADYGHVTHMVGLSTSGGPLGFAGGTAAGKEFLPPAGPQNAALTELREHVAGLTPLAAPRSGLRPTIVLRDLDIGQGLRSFGHTGNFDLEVHGTSISTPEATLQVQTTGDVLLDGVTVSSRTVSIASWGGSLQVSRSDMRFETGSLAASAGMMISDSEITAYNGSIYLMGESPEEESGEIRLPGGPITVTRSSLRALVADPDSPSWLGMIDLFTSGAPIALTDNLELLAHSSFRVETTDGSFGETGIEFARNAGVRASALELLVEGPTWVTSHVDFSNNDLSIAGSLRIDGEDGYLTLDFSGNAGVIGDEDGTGRLRIGGNIGGAVAMNGNELQVGESVALDLWTLTAASFSMTDNLFNHPGSLSGRFSAYLRGFEAALLAGNEIAAASGISLRAPSSELVITGNRFSTEWGGLSIEGSHPTPVARVEFTGNRMEIENLEDPPMWIQGVSHLIFEDNVLRAEATEPGISAFRMLGSFDQTALVTGNTFSGFDSGVAISGASGHTLDVTINHNVFDIEIDEPGTAVFLRDVADVIDARHNVWGTVTDVADVEAAVAYRGDTETLGGQVLLDPIALP